MKRNIITVMGCVQGVGFRPFVFRLANKFGLVGWISNTSSGVLIDVQGEKEALELFQKSIVEEKPIGATISQITCSPKALHQSNSFEIKSSQRGADTTLALLPDTGMCQQCLQELLDPNNRRFRYPFLHCISCGPRFSLFTAMPFDRSNTTMSEFQMCGECREEYNDPNNRRFYSQTNCCPACGPKLQLLDNKGDALVCVDSINGAVRLISEGKIVAVKNTGGYQLLVDATNEEAVQRLRRLKHRAKKPFALLMPTLDHVRAVGKTCPMAEQVLTSSAAPIVLIQKREGIETIAYSVSSDSPYYGMMLPHNAVQHLLLQTLNRPLVATSGNVSSSPICMTDEEAISRLSGIADAFLVHNRRIQHRLDDSIVHIMANQAVVLRRARGYIPYALPIPQVASSLFAAGAHQKSAFAFAKGNQIYMSQYIGDLESAETCRSYDEEVAKWKKLLSIEPTETVGDKHPGYYTSHYLRRQKGKTTRVQHHEAHVYSCMVDNQLEPPFFSIVWDGTGFGDDGTIWGGEAFLATGDGIRRFGSLYPFRLPGGEKAVREPRRSALGLLQELAHASTCVLQKVFTVEELLILTKAMENKVNSPLCSSMGRLFDAVSALLGCCAISDFEGQAAILLEAIAYQGIQEDGRYNIPLIKQGDIWLMDWRPMLEMILEDTQQGKAIADIARAFHEALAQGIVSLAQMAQQEKVLLTGGVMQNKLLVELAWNKLKANGFSPFIHNKTPPNDGGCAIGQLLMLSHV